MEMLRLLPTILWLLIALACAPLPSARPAVTAPGSEQPVPVLKAAVTPATVPTPTVRPALHDANTAVELARNDLARRLNISLAAIIVEGVTQDMFPIQELGCPVTGGSPGPQPEGKSRMRPSPPADITLPAFVAAYEVSLRVEARTYIYHVRGGQVVYCGEF